MIIMRWISGFFYGASVLSKFLTELAFSLADVLHVPFIALDHEQEMCCQMRRSSLVKKEV